LSIVTIFSDKENHASLYKETSEEEEFLPSPSPSLVLISQQQQPSVAPTMEQLLAFMQQQQETINTLQQHILAVQTVTSTAATAAVPAVPATTPVIVLIPEVAPPPKFSRERGQVVGFINACCLFMQMRMDQVGDRNRISWVLSYVQGGVLENHSEAISFKLIDSPGS